MICPHCQKAIRDGAAFCKYCRQLCSQGAGPVYRSLPVPHEAPVKVKRYGFLRFLLVLFLLWQCRRIPERVREARTGRIDSISLLPRLPLLPEQ